MEEGTNRFPFLFYYFRVSINIQFSLRFKFLDKKLLVVAKDLLSLRQ